MLFCVLLSVQFWAFVIPSIEKLQLSGKLQVPAPATSVTQNVDGSV